MAILLTALFCLRALSVADWDPTLFTAFGEEALPTRQYAEQRLGDVFLRPSQGHDGKFFFVQANDPWLMDPTENATVLDRPLYRSQRMLYPVLTSAGGLLGPYAIVRGMIIVNILAMGVGSWAIASVAREMGGSPWWGLAFVLNLGFVGELSIGGAGIVSAAAAFAAVTFFLRDRSVLAVGMIATAVLAREVMLLAAAGAGWWLWKRGRRLDATLAIGIPGLAAGLWALYLRLRIDVASGASEIEEIGRPLAGFLEASGSWFADPLDLVIGPTMMLVLILFVRRAVLLDELVVWAFVGFVPLALLFTAQVWRNYFDISRAMAPLVSAFALTVLVSLGERRPARTSVR